MTSAALYTIKPGDQLFAIMQKHYGSAVFLKNQSALIERIRENNEHINDINLVYPGQVVVLPDMTPGSQEIPLIGPAERHATAQVCQEIENLDPATRSFMPIFDTQKIFSATGGGFINAAGAAADAAISDIRRVGLSYYQMKAGTISTNQYNYRRNVALQNADAKLGPFRMGLTPGKTAHQSVRIRPHDAVRTSAVLKEIKTLDRITKLAKNGAVVLRVADLVSTCVKVHTASNDQERTVIMIDAVASTVGAIGATAIAIALVGTPAGWVAIAGIAAAGIAGGFIGEMFGKAIINNMLYDTAGNRMNTQADQIWQSFYQQ